MAQQTRPLRIAIVGAGPAGFYAAQALLQQEQALTIDIFDRLPAPFGLVRYGVAPDHQKIKLVTKVFDKVLNDNRVRFFGHVSVGQDITVAEMQQHYDQILLSSGAASDRKLGVTGEDLQGSHSATEFVAWYNGHPDYQKSHFDLSQSSALIVGVGNVALDVARILAKQPSELAKTDIADNALAQLHTSNVRDIHIVARRGPAQAKFTTAELREFGHLEGVDVIVDPAALELDEHDLAQLTEGKVSTANVEILRDFAGRTPTGQPRRVFFHFCASPVSLLAGSDGDNKLKTVRLEKNRLEWTGDDHRAVGTKEYFEIEAGLVFRSVGYMGAPFPGVPYDAKAGVFPNQQGRVVDTATKNPVAGLYTAGWIKRGPSGVVGTNKPDAIETVEAMVSDWQHLGGAPLAHDAEAIVAFLASKNIAVVSAADWRTIDAEEVRQGKERGRPRVKYTDVGAVMELLGRPLSHV